MKRGDCVTFPASLLCCASCSANQSSPHILCGRSRLRRSPCFAGRHSPRPQRYASCFARGPVHASLHARPKQCFGPCAVVRGFAAHRSRPKSQISTVRPKNRTIAADRKPGCRFPIAGISPSISPSGHPHPWCGRCRQGSACPPDRCRTPRSRRYPAGRGTSRSC